MLSEFVLFLSASFLSRSVYSIFSPCLCFPFISAQVISLAGWVNIMYFVQDAYSFWSWIYFVALIVVSDVFAACSPLVAVKVLFPGRVDRDVCVACGIVGYVTY